MSELGEGIKSPERSKIKPNLLYLEDNDILRGVNGTVFTRLGLSHTDVSTYPEAINAFRSRHKTALNGNADPFNWAFLDFDVPGGSGGEIMREIHEIAPKTVFTLLTGRGPEDPELQKLRDEGISFDALQKGIKLSIDDIKAQIKRAEKLINGGEDR